MLLTDVSDNMVDSLSNLLSRPSTSHCFLGRCRIHVVRVAGCLRDKQKKLEIKMHKHMKKKINLKLRRKKKLYTNVGKNKNINANFSSFFFLGAVPMDMQCDVCARIFVHLF